MRVTLGDILRVYWPAFVVGAIGGLLIFGSAFLPDSSLLGRVSFGVGFLVAVLGPFGMTVYLTRREVYRSSGAAAGLV